LVSTPLAPWQLGLFGGASHRAFTEDGENVRGAWIPIITADLGPEIHVEGVCFRPALRIAQDLRTTRLVASSTSVTMLPRTAVSVQLFLGTPRQGDPFDE